jgi:Tol biopolymer transport system component
VSDTAKRLESALADRYRIERELGAGGMATVYLAHDVRHDRNVALKVLRPELAAVIGADRFLKEIKVTANLQHPHILGLIDSGEVDGLLYYVMPNVEGESLRDRLTHEKQLPIDDAVHITREVASALDYAHRHHVIHRDIKPENILLHDGQALVADFGIALAVSAAGGTRMTETGMSLGTPHYMSPEQAMGEREITARSDVYALGAVLYEMLIGEPPFTGPTAQAIVAKVMTETPRPLLPQRHTVPPHVQAAVLTALEKLPADRFGSAAEFAEALGRPRVAPTIPIAAATGRPAAYGIDWRIAAVIAVVALGVGAAATRLSRPGATPGPLGRFAIELEPTTTFAVSWGQGIALSPDGSLLTFVGRGPRGSQIYVRAMADSIARPVRGTEGGDGPFFSPDGRQIGFWLPQRLLRVPVAGGAPMQITDSAGPFGAWTDRGAVVFVDPSQRTLRLVDSLTGPRDVARSEPGGAFLAISPLPGGRAVLAAQFSGGRNRAHIVAVTLADGTTRDIGLPDAVMARYVSEGGGWVVYEQRAGGPIMAAPFDLSRLRVTGDGRRVAPEAWISYRGVAQWDAAGTSIVYMPPSQPQLVLVDRSGRWSALQGEPRLYHHPRFSPDGRRVVLDITDADGRDLWIADAADRRMSRLTLGETANDAYWSPDGRQLAYTALRGGLRAVFARSADGSGAADSIYADEHDHSSGAWTPDGRALILSTSLTAGLWMVPLAGSRRAVQIPGSRASEAFPAISRDGHWLAYVSDESGRQEVYVRPFPGPGGHSQVSVEGGSEPVFTRDGRELMYREDAGSVHRLIAAAIRTAPTFEVTRRTPLFDATNFIGAIDHANYDVSPDGRSFVMVRGPLGSHIELVQNWIAQLRVP